MKKIICSLAFVSTIVLVSCKSNSGGGSTPTNAIKAMAADTKSGDFKKLSNHMCKADKKVMDDMIPWLENMAKMMGKDIKELMKEKMEKDDKFNLNDVEFKNEKIDGTNATVDVLNKKENSTQTLHLTKEDGSWKICEGLADKTKAAMGGKDLNEGMKEAQEAMKNMKPEDLEALKKMGEEMQKNLKPEDLEKLKKMGEGMKNN